MATQNVQRLKAFRNETIQFITIPLRKHRKHVGKFVVCMLLFFLLSVSRSIIYFVCITRSLVRSLQSFYLFYLKLFFCHSFTHIFRLIILSICLLFLYTCSSVCESGCVFSPPLFFFFILSSNRSALGMQFAHTLHPSTSIKTLTIYQTTYKFPRRCFSLSNFIQNTHTHTTCIYSFSSNRTHNNH